MKKQIMILSVIIIMPILALANTIQADTIPEIRITNIWAFPTNPDTRNMENYGSTTVFMTFQNLGSDPASIINLEANIAESVEIYETFIDDNNNTQTRSIENYLTIESEQTITLEPNGLVIVLNNLTSPLIIGDAFVVNIRFAVSPDAIDATDNFFSHRIGIPILNETPQNNSDIYITGSIPAITESSDDTCTEDETFSELTVYLLITTERNTSFTLIDIQSTYFSVNEIALTNNQLTEETIIDLSNTPLITNDESTILRFTVSPNQCFLQGQAIPITLIGNSGEEMVIALVVI